MSPVKVDVAQEREWLQQKNLTYAGLIGIGVVLVQPFLTAGPLEVSARICVLSFAAAIPLLAALLLLNRQEAFRSRRTRSVLEGSHLLELLRSENSTDPEP